MNGPTEKWTKDMSMQLTKEEIQTNADTEKWSRSIMTSKIQASEKWDATIYLPIW